MSKNSEWGSTGIGFFGAMFLLFLGLKLGGVIDWPWIWVFAPLWGPVVLALAIIAIVLIVAGLIAVFIKD